jgi:hypothetical protein
LHTALEWAFTVAAMIGLVLLSRQHRVAGTLVLSIWLFYPPVYYVMVWSSRYRYPINWTMLLAIAVAAEYAWAKFVPERQLSMRGAQ